MGLFDFLIRLIYCLTVLGCFGIIGATVASIKNNKED